MKPKTIYIVAEIGINHNGDLNICKELIDVASEAGCNAIKLQKRNIDKVYSSQFLNDPRNSPWGTTQRDQKEALEFSLSDYQEIDNYCDQKSIDWFASAWDTDSQLFLRQFNCKYNKIASAMLVNEELLKLVASEQKHTFISTGMSNYNDISIAINIFKQHNCPFELMHAVSTYPMKDHDANLNVIKTLKEKYKCNVGYSGHEVGLVISYAAAAMGITSLERHITLDRAMYGSDQAASLEPVGLRKLVSGVRTIEKALGDGEKRVIDAEVPISRKLREHLDLECNH